MITVSMFKALIKSLRNPECTSKRAPFIQGSPGMGKTQIAAQVARELGIGFKAIHAPLMQPEDYGMPVIHGAKKDQLKFVVSSEKFPLVGSECPENGILLIDDAAQCDASQQKIIANLIQEREIHGQRLKDGWTIVLTGNRVSDRSGSNRLLGHLADRVTLMTLEVSLDDWTGWALENNVKTELVAFIRFRPNLLSNYDAKNDKNATPRGWIDGVNARLGVIPKELEFPCFSGDVGEGPASEFLAFLKIFRNLPNPDSVLLNPEKAEVPTDSATQYAICGALVARVTEVNFDRALRYIKRLKDPNGNPVLEFSALFMRDAVIKCPDIQTTKAFIQWATKEGRELLS